LEKEQRDAERAADKERMLREREERRINRENLKAVAALTQQTNSDQ
jgi:hypothetical protein